LAEDVGSCARQGARVTIPGDVRPAELGSRADAGGAGDVDLDEVAVDHIDADKEEPALAMN
jgi:hypothetical protein